MNVNEMIDCKFWRDKFCNTEFRTGDTLPESGLVYVNIEHIKDFFDKCKQTDRKYTVVSGYSDFGLAKQSEHSVAQDMVKWFPFLIPEIEKMGYQDLFVPARCNKEECDYHDAYSIKCYSFTHATFNEIPANIEKWYVVNLMTKHDRVEGIPLGVGEGDVELISKISSSPPKRDGMLYVNWQTYTSERMQLKQYFINNNFSWATCQEEPNVPKEEYLKEMARHQFVLCPDGNGVDSHRLWEALYLGCIPIVIDSDTYSSFDGLPLIRINSFYYLTGDVLKELSEKIASRPKDLSKATVSHWAKRIKR